MIKNVVSNDVAGRVVSVRLRLRSDSPWEQWTVPAAQVVAIGERGNGERKVLRFSGFREHEVHPDDWNDLRDGVRSLDPLFRSAPDPLLPAHFYVKVNNARGDTRKVARAVAIDKLASGNSRIWMVEKETGAEMRFFYYDCADSEFLVVTPEAS